VASTLKTMENILLTEDRVRKNTGQKINRRIDERTEANIGEFFYSGEVGIRSRIKELNKEWDIERALELTSGINILLGLTLTLTKDKRWLWLSGISAAFLVQHAIQGWCPPLPVLRWFGVRTKNEIEVEKTILKEIMQTME
jgi:hypothetical protein